MIESLQSAVIEEMLRNPVPRSCKEIEAAIQARYGINPAKYAVSVVMQTLKNHQRWNLTITGRHYKRKYLMQAAEVPACDLRSKVNELFEARLWAVRGQV